MADPVRVSQLPAADPLVGTELVPVVQGGVTSRTTAQAIADLAGSSSTYPEHSAAVFVSAEGNDANDGLEPTSAKLTITSALTQASALLSGGADAVLVRVTDGNDYTEATTLTIPTDVHVLAPGAGLIGRVLLQAGASFVIDRHYAQNDSHTMVNTTGTGVDGTSIYRTRMSDGRGIPGGTVRTGVKNFSNVGTAGKNLFVKAETILVGADGRGLGDSTGGTGHLHFAVGDLYLAGANAVGIYGTQSGPQAATMVGFIDHVLETGTHANTSAIVLDGANVTLSLTCNDLSADTAWNLANSASLYLSCTKIVGTRTGTPVRLLIGDLVDDTSPQLGGNLDLNGNRITGSAGTVTTDQPILDVAQTWNDAAVTFAGIKANITDTASAATSNLLDLQVGGSSKASIRKSGDLSANAAWLNAGTVSAPAITLAGDTNTGWYRNTTAQWSFSRLGVAVLTLAGTNVTLAPTAKIGWGVNNTLSFGLVLEKEADDTLAQRRTANPQTFRLYNTWTDASNYERLSFNWNSNVAEILPEAAGTGTLRDLKVGASGGKLGLLGATPVARQAHVADADTAHALNATFSDTEVESALNALATKLNAVLKTLEDFGLHATS
jgi:hypothetical protein